MRPLTWVLGLPLAGVAAVFAVSNRQPVPFDLWPLPMSVEVPAYLAVLAPLTAGLLTGGLLVWVSGTRARLRAHQERRRAESLERQLAATQSSPSP